MLIKFSIFNFQFSINIQFINFQFLKHLIIENSLIIDNCYLRIPHFSGGQSLIELIIAIAIAAIVMPALFFGLITSTNSKAQETQNLAANALLKEGLEVVRSVREANWSNIASNGNYHPTIVSSHWSLVANSETVNQYTRTIVIADTFRDASGNIVTSGTLDPSTKKITVTISWTTPYSSSVSTTVYLSRYLNNLSFLQPTPNLFSTYTTTGSSNVIVSSNSVTVASPEGKGDWCAATPTVVSRANLGGNADATAIWGIGGEAFLGMGTNTSAADFINVFVTQKGQSAATFDDLSNPNRNLNGQYPSGVIDWGTNKWFLSSPFAGDPTQSISYTAAGITSQSFNFVTPQILYSIEAINGNVSASTITLSCTGNPNVVASVPVNGLITINTNWTTACSSVTIASTNGWDTNFDSLVYSSSATVPSSFQDGFYDQNTHANDIYGDKVGSQSYSYIATNDNTYEVLIMQVNSPKVTAVGSVNISGTTDATSVFVQGNTGYVTAGTNFYTFDLTSRSGVKTPLAQLNLSATPGEMFVTTVGSNIYAFVAVSGTTNQLRILDVTNRTSITQVGQLTVSGGAGRGVYASSDGQRAYLVTAQSAQPEFFVINTTTKTAPALVGSFNLGSNNMIPNAVNMVLSKKRAIIVGSGGTQQYVVLNLNNEVSPTQCTGMSITGTNVLDVSPVLDSGNNAYAYLATADTANEFQIVEGGPGTTVVNGIYESVTFDAASIVAFNRVQASFNQPTGTNITFEAAVAAAVAGSCSGASFSYQSLANVALSTSGTTATYNGAIAYPSNVGRCFRYRATLSPDTNQTNFPTLQDIKLNYAP